MTPMSTMNGQADDAPIMQAFHHWIQRNYKHEIINPDTNPMELRSFIVLEDAQAFLNANNAGRLREILSVLFFPDDPVQPTDIIPSYTAVFCTLLCAGKGKFIRHFMHYDNLRDVSLPFEPDNPPPAHFPVDSNDENFFRKFCEHQWKFCASVFRHLADVRFAANRVVPIIYKKKLAEGASAYLWMIKIHPSYNQLLTEERKASLDIDVANTFVLKTYSTLDARMYYENEIAAFRRVGPHSNIIGFHGSFRRGDTYNVILEHADMGTLEDFFKKVTPPTEGRDIINFWEKLFELIAGLWSIHDISSFVEGGPSIFQGWHQDIKPANILVVSNCSEQTQQWKFKLGDLGISHFKRRMTSQENSTANDTFGTRTYGAPECYRPDDVVAHKKLKVRQNIDIWSLGCIFSEAARWITHAYLGVEKYREERIAETRLKPEFQGAPDCFHDGTEVLKAVGTSHQKTINSLRIQDFVTEAVINTMIEDMLMASGGRPSAEALHHKKEKIIRQANKKLAGESPIRPPHPGSPSPRPPFPPVLPPDISLPIQYIRNSMHERNLSDLNQQMLGENVSHSPENMSESLLAQPTQTTLPNAGLRNAYSPMRAPPPPPLEVFCGPAENPTRTRGVTHDIVQHHSVPIFGIPRSTTEKMTQSQTRANISHGMLINGSNNISSTPTKQNHRPTSASYNTKTLLEEEDPQDMMGFEDSNQHMNPGNTPATSSENTHPRQKTTLSPIQPLSQPLRPPPHRNVRYLSLDDALEWRQKRKNSGMRFPIKDKDLQDRLKDRDHVFLIDDSISMSNHWKELVRVFMALSYIVKDVDPNGIDVYFTVSSDTKVGQKKTGPLVQMVQYHRKEGATDINIKLSKILNEYRDKLGKPKSSFSSLFGKVKPLSLYVLTNGIWESQCEAERPIRNLVSKLNELGMDQLQAGIQFIGFGKDTIGLQRLEYLDSGLNLDPDIVDFERSSGNVWKMLLGAINKTFDDDEKKPSSQAGETGATSSTRTSGVSSPRGLNIIGE